MANTFNPQEDRDYRTLDVTDRVIIVTRNDFSSRQYINNRIQHYPMIELDSEHEYEPRGFEMKEDKRHLSLDQIPGRYTCTCGYTLRPKDNGFRHQALIECQCDQCRAKIFVEIPYKRNYEKNPLL